MARALLLVLAAVLIACTSPEATRMRAGGPGADVGNREQTVLMHEGSQPFWHTPRKEGISGPPLEPSRQAQRLSRR